MRYFANVNGVILKCIALLFSDIYSLINNVFLIMIYFYLRTSSNNIKQKEKEWSKLVILKVRSL